MKYFLKYTMIAGLMIGVVGVKVARADDYCREFTQTVYIGGKPQQGYGTACMASDGSWDIVSEAQAAPLPQPAPIVYTSPPRTEVRYVVDRRPVYRPFIFGPSRVVYRDWDRGHRRGHHRGHGWHR